MICGWCRQVKRPDEMKSFPSAKKPGTVVRCNFCKACAYAVSKKGRRNNPSRAAAVDAGRASFKADRDFARHVAAINRGVATDAKPCLGCGKVLPLEAFAQRSGALNKERGTLEGRCNECRKARKAEAYRRVGRNTYLLGRYGISEADFDAMLAAQGGKCAICGSTEPRDSKGWQVDHDHRCCAERSRSCGKCIRGIVCRPCNTAIGMMNDSPELLMAAAQYIAGVSRMMPAAG